MAITGTKKKETVRESVRRICAADGQEISYHFIRKPIKNMYLRVKADGKIEVTAGAFMSGETADRFVLSKARFIEKHLLEIARKQEEPDETGIHDGGSFRFLGEMKAIRVEKDPKDQVLFLEEAVVIRLPDPWDEARVRTLFERALLRKIRELYLNMVEEFHPKFSRWKIPYPTVRLRAMKSRYGSCTMARKTITLNTLMIGSPIESIEYVVVHELAHFVVPNHSARFYQVVAEVMPDYKERKKGLRIAE